MKPNVVIDEGKFKTTMPVKLGTILLHPDWPMGMAVRDIEAGEILEYDSLKSTKDVILKIKIISKSSGSRPLSISDLGKTIIFDPEANKGSVSISGDYRGSKE